MPYALFSKDAKLSKAYPTEADVWAIARRSGLVVDVTSENDKLPPQPVLDHDYEIRPCNCEANEDPARNKADAEREAQLEPEFSQIAARDKAASPIPLPPRGPVFDAEPNPLRRGAHQRSLRRAERDADPLAVQPADSACHFQHPARAAREILHEGNFVRSQRQRFGFKDSLGKTRRSERRKNQP